MRAKWRKIIWAILGVQLLVLHLLFLDKVFGAYRLDYFLGRVAGHFGLPYFLYARWKQMVVLGWLATAGVILLIHYRNYRKFRSWCIGQIQMVSEDFVRQSLREAVLETGLAKRHARAFLYQVPGIREPFVMGFRRPILLLPEKKYSRNVLKFIFLHECHHIRQKDTLYKLFWLLMQSLLWFQPLIYLLAALGNRDVEVACDEAVVEGKDMESRKEYGYALLECLQQGRERGQAYSAYFYHGKGLMKARINAIMKEDRKWDVLAYVGIAVLLLDLGLNIYRVGESLYERYQAGREEPLVSIYEGYELPDAFTPSAVSRMTALEPVEEKAYREELWAEDRYPWKEFSELPYAAEGPWQVRIQDADHYSDAVGLLAQRYLSYFIDWKWATERDSETHPEFQRLEYVHTRMLAGDRQESVFAVAFRYPAGTKEDIETFPEELAQKARFTCEYGTYYYAYFDWAVQMRMVRDYVFELEGIAETKKALAAFQEKYSQADFSDIPALDLLYEVPGPGKTGLEDGGLAEGGASSGNAILTETGGTSGDGNTSGDRPESGDLSAADKAENDSAADANAAAEPAESYQMEERDGTLWVSGADGVFREVPVPMEELLTRGDEMDGQLMSLPPESYQLDEHKQIFAYGGSNSTPFAVVYYDEEKGDFRKSMVTAKYFGGRRIFVDFPENSQDGFLIFTGERVVWQETSILFRTRDGGETWQEVGAAGPDWNKESHSLTMDAAFLDNQLGFVTIRSSEEPNIWRTADGGEHWERVELPDVPEWYSIGYAPERQGDLLVLYVGMEDYTKYGGEKAKYESTDRGETWEYKGLVLRK